MRGVQLGYFLPAQPQAQRTSGNFIRTFAALMSAPMRPGLDPRRFADTLRMPQPERPVLSADSVFWRQEHGVPPMDAPSSTMGRAFLPADGERVGQHV
jgi:hypothetical protein